MLCVRNYWLHFLRLGDHDDVARHLAIHRNKRGRQQGEISTARWLSNAYASERAVQLRHHNHFLRLMLHWKVHLQYLCLVRNFWGGWFRQEFDLEFRIPA